jgi:gamma-glutamylcyclotransferase (GGCT)/AIG2-like uncharacterized protein YtfP
MDNTRDLPSYKYYVDPATDERPAVFVSFLDLERDARSRVSGILFEVDEPVLAALDLRERNYGREDVTDAVDPRPGGRVWAYFGNEDARARFARGRLEGTAIVVASYYERVRADLERIGAALEEPPLPIMRLRRVDLDR